MSSVLGLNVGTRIASWVGTCWLPPVSLVSAGSVVAAFGGIAKTVSKENLRQNCVSQMIESPTPGASRDVRVLRYQCEFGHTSMTKLNHCRLYQYLHPAQHQRLLFPHDKQRSKPYEHFEVSTAQQEGWTNQATNDVSRYGHVSNHLRTLFSRQ